MISLQISVVGLQFLLLLLLEREFNFVLVLLRNLKKK